MFTVLKWPERQKREEGDLCDYECEMVGSPTHAGLSISETTNVL